MSKPAFHAWTFLLLALAACVGCRSSDKKAAILPSSTALASQKFGMDAPPPHGPSSPPASLSDTQNFRVPQVNAWEYGASPVSQGPSGPPPTAQPYSPQVQRHSSTPSGNTLPSTGPSTAASQWGGPVPSYPAAYGAPENPPAWTPTASIDALPSGYSALSGSSMSDCKSGCCSH